MLVSSLVLAGCSHSVPPATTLDTTVGQLNRSLSHLSEQSSALAYQHRMNAASTHGAWLVPLANSPVELLDPHARLLLQLAPPPSGTGTVLQVKNAGAAVLPPFELTAALSTLPTDQQETTSAPQPLTQQVIRQITPLSPGEQVRFILNAPEMVHDQSLVVNVHQFRPFK
ncbi:DUF3251 domain-containing protein [Tatumella sp. UBA2305]|uniref:DUF3251 domain-containing protein n=1 Tax=Tatumella sp. UBA2305 TaxID=1947647 RepID=UPI0025D5CFCB|nr:DUF3251 domain-containing protein [Tatumella sp. UBA2305]